MCSEFSPYKFFTISKIILFILLSLLRVIQDNTCVGIFYCSKKIEFLLDRRNTTLSNFDIIVSIRSNPERTTDLTEINIREIGRIYSNLKINVFSTIWNSTTLDSNDGPTLIFFPCLNETDFFIELSNVVTFLNLRRQNRKGATFWTPIFVFAHPRVFPQPNLTENDTLVTEFAAKLQIDSCLYILYTVETDTAQTIQVVREIYSVRKSRINQAVEVKDGSTRILLDEIIYKTRRRSHFQKSTVIAVGLDDPDYPLATEFKPNTTQLVGGFEVEVYHYLRDALNFTEVAIKGTGYVREGPNQTLTGYSTKLNSEEADIAIGSGEFLEYRMKGPDGITYIHPIFHANVIAFFKQPPASSIRNIFTQTFTIRLWICSLAVWILIVFLLRVSVKLVRWYNGANNSNDDRIADESVIWATGVICQQGWHTSPHSTPVKIVFFCGIFTGLISYVAYSAALVSILAVEVVPIREFKDLITEKFYITSDSHIPTAKVVVKELENTRKIPKLAEGVRNVEISENLEKLFRTRFALITIPDSFYPVIQQNYTNSFICGTVATKVVSPRPLKSSCFIKRGSPLREYFNYKILVMQERGVKFRMIKEYVYGTSVQCLQSSGSVQLQLGLRDLFTAFAILISGFAMSLFLALAEKLYSLKIVANKEQIFR